MLQKLPEKLESVLIEFSMNFNLKGVLTTELGRKITKKLNNDLTDSGSFSEKVA